MIFLSRRCPTKRVPHTFETLDIIILFHSSIYACMYIYVFRDERYYHRVVPYITSFLTTFKYETRWGDIVGLIDSDYIYLQSSSYRSIMCSRYKIATCVHIYVDILRSLCRGSSTRSNRDDSFESSETCGKKSLRYTFVVVIWRK